MSHWWEASVWLKWLASPYFNLLRAEQLMKRREELEQELRAAKDPAERKQKAEELRQQMDDISEAMKVITGDPFAFVHQTKIKGQRAPPSWQLQQMMGLVWSGRYWATIRTQSQCSSLVGTGSTEDGDADALRSVGSVHAAVQLLLEGPCCQSLDLSRRIRSGAL